MSNEAAVQWGRMIRYSDIAIQAAMSELGAVQVRIPCAETKLYHANLGIGQNVAQIASARTGQAASMDLRDQAAAFQRARERDTVERISVLDTTGIQGRLRQEVDLEKIAVSDAGWRPANPVVEIERGVSDDGKVEVVGEFECAALDGATMLLLQVNDGLSKPSYRVAFTFTDRAGNPVLDPDGNFLDPGKRAAVDAFVAKTVALQEERLGGDPEMQAEVEALMRMAAEEANLAEAWRKPMGDTGLEQVVFDNSSAWGDLGTETTAPPRVRSAGEN